MKDLETGFELHRTERYSLHEAIGRGGMASVHIGLVEGSFGFSRIVAIKRLHPQLASAERFVAMIVSEAHVASRIRHVNVVSTLDVLSARGEVFVVMEYVRGASLARLVEDLDSKGELVPLSYVVPILVGALRGLDAAHEATDVDGKPLGVVHRDVSPQNVLVGVGGVSRVIDFGVARAMRDGDVTKSGEFKGKLSYAAPEQVTGGEVTRRTDIFAAGIMLWELLTGERLFKGESDIETFRKVVESKIPDPREMLSSNERMRASRTLDELEALAPIAMRALERDPEGRYATAAEMARAIDAAAPSEALPRVGAWVQRVAATKLVEEQAIIARIEHDAALRRGPARSTSVADTIEVATQVVAAGPPTGLPPLAGPHIANPPPRAPRDAGATPTSPTVAEPAAGPQRLSLPLSAVVALTFAAAAGAGLAGVLVDRWARAEAPAGLVAPSR